jgi:hypothetical protein
LQVVRVRNKLRRLSTLGHAASLRVNGQILLTNNNLNAVR